MTRALHLGIVGPLPPSPTGPASYVANLLPALERRCDVTCFVEDVADVDRTIRSRTQIRHLEERFNADCDLLLYQLANNPMHVAVLDAAMSGPPGMVVLHDASVHHLLTNHLVGAGDLDAHRSWLRAAHGERGDDLGLFRRWGGTEIEQFVFDALSPVLERHRACMVHNSFAADVVRHRNPGLPVFKVPHFAPRLEQPSEPHVSFGRPGDVVIAHLGFITRPKRYELLCQAVRELIDLGYPVHLAFLGEDHTHGHLTTILQQLDLTERSTVSGWLDDHAFLAAVSAIDVAVSLRWPHVGESSGTLATLLAAGKPVVVEAIGSWREVPEGAVVRARSASVEDVVVALESMVGSVDARAIVGAAAHEYATTALHVDRFVESLISVAEETVLKNARPPEPIIAGRARAVAGFLAGGTRRLTEAMRGGGAITPLLVEGHDRRLLSALASLPPARPGARLVDVGSIPPMLRIFHTVWGYDAVGVSRYDPIRPGRRLIELDEAGGLPAMTVPVESVDIERHPLPFATGSIDVVICWEVLEHLGRDPMFLLHEINRILVGDGLLHLTTPNSASAISFARVAQGETAGIWPVFLASGGSDRHNREYTPAELVRLLEAAGFRSQAETTTVWASEQAHCDALTTVDTALAARGHRGDNIVVHARKVTFPLERFPLEFYA